MAGLFLCLALPLAAPSSTADAAPARPSRIVSLDLCADQLVLQLADRSRIAGLSFLAADPGLSAFAGEAKGLRQLRGSAEEVVALKPDLVIVGPFGAQPAVQMLRRLGLPLMQMPLLRNLADVHAAVRAVAAAVGEEARGRRLLTAIDAGFARFGQPPANSRPTALIYQANGIVVGGDSLQSAVLERAGYRNAAAALGLPHGGYLPLEKLIQAMPDVLVIDSYRPDLPSLAQQFLAQPALRARGAGRPRVLVPSRLWFCPGPGLGQAAAELAAARPAMREDRQ